VEVLHDFLEYPWAWRALLASIMVAVSCGILGTFITLRNMSLLGDALSHAVLPGIVVSYLFLGYNVLGFYIGAVIAGLLCAVAITWLQKKAGARSDAAIGIVFSAMFAMGVIGISYLSRTQGVHLDLKDFLFGNVLGVTDFDLKVSALILGFVILCIVSFYKYFFISSFQPKVANTLGIPEDFMHYFIMLLLSFVVVSALQTVGVIMVVSMLIAPSSTALLMAKRLPWVLVISGILGAVSAFLGIYFSIYLETTPGPAIALVSTGIYLLAVLFAPKKGLWTKLFISQKHYAKIITEDFLKWIYKRGKTTDIDIQTYWKSQKAPYLTKKYAQFKIRDLGLTKFSDHNVELTSNGLAVAERIIRAHRLWETFMVNKMGMAQDQIHREAEGLEHVMTEEYLKELEEFLDFPRQDPHGSPIP